MKELSEGQQYCSKIMQAIIKNQEEACSHIVRAYNVEHTRFEMEEQFNHLTQQGGQKWTVILSGRYCQCGRFTAFHYPCSHVIAVCAYVSIDFF